MQKIRGFTLNEVLIVVLILGVLAAIAYPLYQRYVLDARLNQAQQALLENAQSLEKYYNTKYTFKKNSTTWADLTHTQTAYFCIKMQGNPRGIADGKFTIKAVSLDKKREPRVLTINQDHIIAMCESSETSCQDSKAFFSNPGRQDKNCKIMN